MKAKDEKNRKSDKSARKKAVKPNTKSASGERHTSELNEPRWSVVSFERCLASGLTYERAASELEKAATKKVSGLCIITDEAAGKIAYKK